VHLRDVHPAPRPARRALQVEAQLGELRVVEPLDAVLRRRPAEDFGVAPVLDPAVSQRHEPGADVDAGSGIRVGARAVVDIERRIGLAAEHRRRVGLGNFAHGHADVLARALDIDLCRVRKRLYRRVIDMRGGGKKLRIGVHGASFGGITRIRF
jgi:hypothetical protein